jgi:hypothetical protein
MQNLTNRNLLSLSDKLIKSTINDIHLNRQLTNLHTFSSFNSLSINELLNRRKHLINHNKQQINSFVQLSSKLLNNQSTTNQLFLSYSFGRLIKCSNYCQFYSVHKKEFEFLDQNFKTTGIQEGTLPQIRIPKSLLHLKSVKKVDMSLNSPGKAKWHLKNVFYLLKTNYEDDEDDKRFKNSNRFNVLTDFRKEEIGWQCLITLFHPSKQIFKASSRRKQEAEDNASYNALLWLKEQGKLSFSLI